MRRMTIAERIESHRRRVRRHMVGTVAVKLWKDDFARGCRRDYDYNTDPEVHRLVDALLADPTVRHLDIPARAYRAYCAE